ncbi:MAG: helix-turn-helix domain-containing protein [Alphaproteobacteria bacterium]|nr:helix-turn-helix domain-containing protein [Alphaproteobacteria bacterium]
MSAITNVRRGEHLTRGVLAARTGCNLETIRYYERIGLLPAPPRSAGGYRLYGLDLLKRVNFIRRSRELGFTLAEVGGLLRLVDGRKFTCAQVEKLARDHVHEIRRKIADLRKFERVLETMASQCGGGTVPQCPIIDALFAARSPSASRHRRQSLALGARSAKSALAKSNGGCP